MSDKGTVVVDASGTVAGRLSSWTAKRLLEGVKVVVLNAEESVITGKKNMIMGEFKRYHDIESKINPRRHGPFKAKTPHGIFRDMVDGMLPRKKTRGREARRRLRVYTGTPPRYREVDAEMPEGTRHEKSPYGFLTLEEIAEQFGWRRTERVVEV